MKIPSPSVRILSQFLHLGILIDPNVCHYIDTQDIAPLPSELAEQVPLDDAYLFQTALAAGGDTIVTSDERLLERVTRANDFGISLRLRDEYIVEYLVQRD